MSIVIITGKAKTGKTLIANALRNNQIANKFGALLIDEDQGGDPNHLLEKIIVAESLGDKAAKDIPWKPNSMVIFVGKKSEMLDTFEEMVPGFTKQLGPVYFIETYKG